MDTETQIQRNTDTQTQRDTDTEGQTRYRDTEGHRIHRH